jgi:hypothetical protein
METLRAPRPEITFYDVECSNEQCAALMRCKKSDLLHRNTYQPMSSTDTQGYWVMECPHCGRDTEVDFWKTRVLP